MRSWNSRLLLEDCFYRPASIGLLLQGCFFRACLYKSLSNAHRKAGGILRKHVSTKSILFSVGLLLKGCLSLESLWNSEKKNCCFKNKECISVKKFRSGCFRRAASITQFINADRAPANFSRLLKNSHILIRGHMIFCGRGCFYRAASKLWNSEEFRLLSYRNTYHIVRAASTRLLL